MNSEQLEKTFDQYLDTLMEKKGLDKMPEEKQKDFREKSKKMLVAQFNDAVLRAMPDDKLNEFEKALDNNASPDELGKIVDAAKVDVSKIFETILNSFADAVMNTDINNITADTKSEAGDVENETEADDTENESNNNMKAEA